MRTHALALGLLCMAAACSVGAPVVDHLDDGPKGVANIMCALPPACAALPELELPHHPAAPLSAARVLELSAQDGESELRLDAADWSGVNVTIHARAAYRVTLNAPHLDTVFITLDGPITLRIVDALEVRDLRLSTRSADAALELENVQGDQLSVGEADQSFRGTVSMHLVALSDVDLIAPQLSAESARFEEASILVGNLNLLDAELRIVSLMSDVARLSAFEASQTIMHYCVDASVIAGKLQSSVLSTCPDGNLRLYGCEFYAGELGGEIELDMSTVSTSRIGLTLPTHIVAFESEITSCNLCEEARGLALGSRSHFRCGDCVESFDSQNTCTLAEETSVLENDNFCAVLRKDTSLASCPDGAPTRKRPRS